MKKTKAPIIQQHELTWRCNNNCQFCYNPERCIQSFVPREEDQQRNIAVAKESVRRGVMAACPTGGEPLLVGDHLFEVMDIYKDGNCYLSINSNGRLVTKSLAIKLQRHGLQTALISIHGQAHVHDQMVGDEGAFQETWQGIANLREAGVRVMPNFVATTKNISSLLAVGQQLLSSGVRAMTVTPFLPSWGAPGHDQFVMEATHYRVYFESCLRLRSLGMKIDSTLPIPPCALINFFPSDWQTYLEVHTPRVCMAGRSFGVVSPNGQFRSCIQAPFLPDFGGDVLENYESSWGKSNEWAAKRHLPLVCRDCSVLSVCGGGCRTGCLWVNHGKVFGETMYIGDSLSADLATLWQQRLEFSKVESAKMYKWNPGVRIRDDGFGTIVFNPRNQSFTVLSEIIKPRQGVVAFSSPKAGSTLRALGALREVSSGQGDSVHCYSRELSVLDPGFFLPRLGAGLTSEKVVYNLRADTGERYFF